MTALLFSHSPELVVVVMDTLATDQGRPYSFMSKVTCFQHADMLVAGTGLAAVLSGWVNYLSTQCVFRDIDGAAAGATEELRRLQKQTVGTMTGPNLTTTIYHFGFERDSDAAVRYVFRSTSGFVPERVETPGFGAKPHIDGAPAYGPADDIDDYIALAERMRREQDALGAAGIAIGGELIMTLLAKSGMRSLRIHAFDDFESDWNVAMLGTQSPPA
ncbi:hypothetical protein [Plantibacter flavus]|uniref:hypothetical protein n=1 Tax=Plantibacter flavus TaxID=150123 RepID=UPI003390EBF5